MNIFTSKIDRSIMKYTGIILPCLIFISFNAFAQKFSDEFPRLKQYYFVMLTKGPNSQEIDSLTLIKIQEGHMANIHKMADEGKLLIAGPFGDDGNWRGIFIFDAASEDEVIALLKNDPAIQAGRLSYEIHPWWTEKGSCLK
jgi:uncharacterized protein YciI